MWFGGTHEDMTKEALQNFVFTFSHRGLKYSLIMKQDILKNIMKGNSGTDSGDTKNKQEYHFCADRTADSISGVKESDFRFKYDKTLKEVERVFSEALEPIMASTPFNERKEKCNKALEYLGRLNHMWQDYFGHGRQSVHELGKISGSPDNIQAIPSSFSYMGFWGNHGGVQNWFLFRELEPGKRATDKDTRLTLSVSYTKAASKPLLDRWIGACKCVYYKEELRLIDYCCG